MDDHNLMGIRADTLFRYDARGRMLCSNEPDSRPAPRVFLGRTSSGHVTRFGEAVPDTLASLLEERIERQPPVDALKVSPAVLDAVREVLRRHSPVIRETGGPAYRFPPSSAAPGATVQLTEANLELARDTYPWLYKELRDCWPCFAVVRDGAAVSVCFSSRIGATANEAGVDTLPGFRGRGYAAAVTAAWGASLSAAGRTPIYSTAWENLPSQAVARRVGLILFGADATWT
jgi:hypothetical protein